MHLAHKQCSSANLTIPFEPPGINLSYVRLVHAKGCNVIIADLGLRPDAEKFVEETKKSRGPRVIFQKCDVTNWKDLEGIIPLSLKEFGDVPDVVVPGAGVFEPVCCTNFPFTFA